ncbi:hypothetical protein LR48_Vigan08g038900 [Vigna angularis]|uniref:Uncharacterized protein n=1 Tax=Phaseolus angularis TaxID=3914 RepID=A0A0L9V3S3_PHAAN|nr:hypothetical protein LR48_Vigan08g038900 [Vigna angularis]
MIATTNLPTLAPVRENTQKPNHRENQNRAAVRKPWRESSSPSFISTCNHNQTCKQTQKQKRAISIRKFWCEKRRKHFPILTARRQRHKEKPFPMVAVKTGATIMIAAAFAKMQRRQWWPVRLELAALVRWWLTARWLKGIIEEER